MDSDDYALFYFQKYGIWPTGYEIPQKYKTLEEKRPKDLGEYVYTYRHEKRHCPGGKCE